MNLAVRHTPSPIGISHEIGAVVATIHIWLDDTIFWVGGLHAACSAVSSTRHQRRHARLGASRLRLIVLTRGLNLLKIKWAENAPTVPSTTIQSRGEY